MNKKYKISSNNFQIYKYKTSSVKKKREKKVYLKKEKKALKCNAVQRNSIQLIRYGKER